MGDMSMIIVPKSDQINADDLLGRTINITVTDVTIRGGQEQPISIHFAESDKVFRPCKSMCRVMAQAWGLDSKQYIGRSMTLYCDPTVKFGPLAVGGIRISHMSHIDGPMTMALTATKGVKKAYKVLPLAVAAPKPDKVADGVRDLLARIAAGEDVVAEPAVIKQRAWLAEKRPELAAQIDAALAAQEGDPFEGPSDEQRGETHQIDAATILAKIATFVRLNDLNNYVGSWADQIAGMSDDDRADIAKAQAERADQIRGAQA